MKFRLLTFPTASDTLIFVARARIECHAAERDLRCALFGIAVMQKKGKTLFAYLKNVNPSKEDLTKFSVILIK